MRLTFTTLAASPPLCQGSQNSHMLVSKATNRDLSPGRVDRRWMKEHESGAALANCLYFLLNRSKLKCAQHRIRKRHHSTNFSVILFALGKKIAWSKISHCKWMKQAGFPGFTAVPLEERERIKFLFSKVGTEWISPINVKRQIRGLCKRGDKSKNKSHWASAQKQVLLSVV